MTVVMCLGCKCPLRSYCYDEHGVTLPMCRGDGCSEHTSTRENELCRDCDIERQLDSMECKCCRRMRYRTDTITTPLAAALWGDPCDCAVPL